MKLLIIDDEPHIRQMMRLTLEVAGYQVDEAADGSAGMARFGDGREYAAVVLDQGAYRPNGCCRPFCGAKGRGRWDEG